jgi:two-component system, sensor histidine kinase LadS
VKLIHQIVFLFLFVSLASYNSYAIPFVLTKDKPVLSIPVERYVYYIEDKAGTITIDSLLQNATKYSFKQAKQQTLNFGFSNSTIWLKISIDNQTTLNKDFLFSIDYALLNEVTFYEIINGKILRQIKTGENLPFKTRAFNDKSYVFPLSYYPLQFKTYFVRINSNGDPLQIPMQINTPTHDKEVQSIQLIGVAIFYGYLIFSILLNILLFLNFKKRYYFYFGGFVSLYALFIFINDGFAFQYFWPNSPWFSNHSIIIATSVINFFMLAFARDFLNYTGKIKKVSNIFFVIFFAFFIASFIGYPFHKYMVRFANGITFVTLILIFSISVYYIRRAFSSYNLVFLLSYFFVMIGTTVYIMRNLNIIPENYITVNSLKLGFFTQIVVLTFALIIKFKIDLTDINKKLAFEVNEQTAEIRAQNEKLSEHNNKIELQSKEITDSIIYAKRIQIAILPDHQKFTTYLKDHFIMYKPKHIVSGDFYWFAEKNGKVYIAVADCTGHGVPGGFLSMLGISFLNQIINKDIVLPPNLILNELQRLILNTLSKKMDDGMTTRDGMDISLCAIDFVKNKFEFSGANNPVYLVRNNEVTELKVDKMPIGHYVKTDKQFTHQEFDIIEGDRIYLLTDGYTDQFNIDSKKRFTKPKLRHLLTEINQKPFIEQHKLLDDTFNKWRGNSEQIDDILVMGLLL